MGAQLLSEPLAQADLSTTEEAYFGAPLGVYENLSGFPFDPSDGDLTRHSYVFQAVYWRGDDYGGIQLRARIHTYGDLREKLRQWLEAIAHKAAFMYDSGIETSSYGPPTGKVRGTKQGDGYLTGFNSVATYQNVESEPIGRSEIPHEIGVIDWSTEVYIDEDFDDASLSGIAQGLAYPYETVSHKEPGREAIHVPPTKWHIGFEDSWGDYFARPAPRTEASRRYLKSGAGGGKAVYVNNLKVGSLGPKGRVRINPEYQVGDGLEYRGNHSREGLVQKSAATYQAIRRGGRLYQTGETEHAVYLSTARAKPDGWQEADPDSVPVDLRVQEGRPDRWITLLRLADLDDPIDVECRRDDQILSHLGYSSPRYTHKIDDTQHWPRGDSYSPGGWSR